MTDRLVVGISGATGTCYGVRVLTAATEYGAIIMPPVPAFYLRPYEVAEIVDHTVSRALDLLGIEVPGTPRWGEEEGAV